MARENYIRGNAVRVEEQPLRLYEPQRGKAKRVKKNREKIARLNPAYVVFLLGAVAITAVALIHYLNLKSELTTTMNSIATLEKQYANIKMTNDEDYSAIEASINVEAIRRIAIEELGMTYAGDGQIITFSTEGEDYVRQVKRMEEVASTE